MRFDGFKFDRNSYKYIYIYIDPISILPRFNNSKIEDIWNLYSKKSPLRGIESTNFFSKENSKFLRGGVELISRSMKITAFREKRCSHSLELCQIVGELTLAQLNATATNLSPILLSPPPPDYTTFKLPPISHACSTLDHLSSPDF